VATHDYVISNGTGSAVRSDINGALAAIVSQNSNASAPATTYAYMTWADTSAGVMKMRNSANSAWISLYQLDGEWTSIAFENGTAAAPSIYFKDSGTDTGIYSPGTDQVAISTGGTGRLFIASDGKVGVGAAAGANVNFDVSSAATTIVRSFASAGNQAYLSAAGNNGTVGTSSFDIIQDGTSVAYLYQRANQSLLIGTNNQTRMTILGGGGVGINTTSPSTTLQVVGTARFGNGTAGTVSLTSDSNLSYYDSLNNATTGFQPGVFRGTELQFHTNSSGTPTVKATIDSSGRLLVGTSSTSANGAQLQIVSSTEGMDVLRYGNNAAGTNIVLYKTRGATNVHGIVSNDDALGQLTFSGSDGTNYIAGASIKAAVDGTPGANDMPGRLVFSTTADGASSPTERMRIKADGTVLIGKTSSGIGNAGIELDANAQDAMFTTFGATPVFVNRTSNDGVLIDFQQDSTSEGNISVSGTTVSYNGAHLSRWSQLPGGATREEILRGTVLSNLDEMCGWGDEDNEQLNRMKVSDVEGDKNVSGVFQSWDDDDDTYTNDFYCAMTGDFIIRIAEGVTVQRGDLLMSAGDGTAKPQDDDIIRSKTVAKVTSTHVTCTYEDGSYCVPCVLMAC